MAASRNADSEDVQYESDGPPYPTCDQREQYVRDRYGSQDLGPSATAEDGTETAAYCGGWGPAWEAAAEMNGPDPNPGPSQYDQPWWDGERMASDRERNPRSVAELEAEEREAGA